MQVRARKLSGLRLNDKVELFTEQAVTGIYSILQQLNS